MLRPRDPEPAPTARPDPLGSITVGVLGLIALGLFAAAILAVYTYSTPAVELPLVITISLAFGALLFINLLRLALRRVRAGR
jgi:ABC-type uncharacterized transport system permease subunit